MLVGVNLVVKSKIQLDVSSLYSQICHAVSESVMYKFVKQYSTAIRHVNGVALHLLRNKPAHRKVTK